jgi:hypothetical protein
MIHNSHVLVCITMATTQCKAVKEKTNGTNHLVYRIGFLLCYMTLGSVPNRQM